MKSLLIALLAIIATAKSQECEPNSVFKIDCNTCFCSPDGKIAGCTLMRCNEPLHIQDLTRNARSIEIPESQKSKQVCEPGTMFSMYCNTCTCMEDGINVACTLMACNPAEWNKDGSRKTRSIEIPEFVGDEKDCEPHKSFKYYCNTCMCTADGKMGGCTLMYCDPAVWNRDGTLKAIKSEETKQYCEPGTTFMYYCNACICSKDGKNAACTLMGCDLNAWNEDGTLKISENTV